MRPVHSQWTITSNALVLPNTGIRAIRAVRWPPGGRNPKPNIPRRRHGRASEAQANDAIVQTHAAETLSLPL